MRGSDSERPRDGHTLALAAGKREPALAHERVEPVREALDQLGEARALGGGNTSASVAAGRA